MALYRCCVPPDVIDWPINNDKWYGLLASFSNNDAIIGSCETIYNSK